MEKERAHRGGGFGGSAAQHHPRFVQSFAAFASIAGRTRADHVIPNVRAAAMSRNNMVDGQVVCLNAAVLTREIVAAKYGAPRQAQPRPRAIYLLREADDRGTRKLRRGRENIPATVGDDLCFAANDQHDRAMRVANIERFVILIQYQDVLPHTISQYITMIAMRQAIAMEQVARFTRARIPAGPSAARTRSTPSVHSATNHVRHRASPPARYSGEKIRAVAGR